MYFVASIKYIISIFLKHSNKIAEIMAERIKIINHTRKFNFILTPIDNVV